MTDKNFSIVRRFALLTIALITAMGLLFIAITFFATTAYHQASTQLLNKDVAGHVAKFTYAFTNKGLDKTQADSVFYNAMVLNPNTEVYFLDTAGNVLYSKATEAPLKQQRVDPAPIKKYLASSGNVYIKGADPRDPGNPKIFSAATVGNGGATGYIYVILDSQKTESIMTVLFGSHVMSLVIKAIAVIIALSFLIVYGYARKAKKNFMQLVTVLARFESGDYTARFSTASKDEMQPVTNAFNKMADLLTDNINKVSRSEEDRKVFIANISHDLRTPLAIARGYCETLLLQSGKRELLPEEREKYLQLVFTKMVQIENMVKQLFELSKMEAVEFAPKKEPFVLSEIVQEAVNNFQLLAAEKNVRLKCVQCLYHVWVNADISLMERVVQNLVENAVKNTPEGGSIEAAIAVENQDLLFTLANDGPPLRNELMQWINDYKDSGITDNRPQKPGLGLLIVQKILHLHNTRLEATVKEARTVFCFRLPVYQSPSS